MGQGHWPPAGDVGGGGAVTDVQEELMRRSEALGLNPKRLREIMSAVNQSRNPMYALTLAAVERDSIEAAIQYLVAQCRAAGYTWAAIGSTLGLTKQGAQQRYGVNGS